MRDTRTTVSVAHPTSIADLRPKMRLQGIVKRTDLFGAFVDLGLEYDGLVHISQLRPDGADRVTDVVQGGDQVTVWVTQVDAAQGRISLTMIEPLAVDWEELEEEQIYTGIVTRIEPYGAFVDIGAERPGLLHVREMATGYVRHPADIVELGDEVEVKILRLDRRKRRMDLTMMGLRPEVVEEEEDEPLSTAMEFALQKARGHERQTRAKQRPSRQPISSEQEDILVRTLREHGGRRSGE